MAEDSVTVWERERSLLGSRYSNWAADGVQRDHRILSCEDVHIGQRSGFIPYCNESHCLCVFESLSSLCVLGEWSGERNNSEKPGTETSTRGGGHLETKVKVSISAPHCF